MRFPRRIFLLLVNLILIISAACWGGQPSSLPYSTTSTGEVNGEPGVAQATATSGAACPTPDANPEICPVESVGEGNGESGKANGEGVQGVGPPVVGTTVGPPEGEAVGGEGTNNPGSLPVNPPIPCPSGLCNYFGFFLFERPVAAPGRQTIDIAYRFGTTQAGTRDPHHGVELLNSHGTPVLAAAEGKVVVAGDDRQIFHGPYSYFYGNLVILEHLLPPDLAQALPEDGRSLYTLYGHLSQISVEIGEQVRAEQEIGQVGMSGVATGSHLHFEVRLGENTYQNSRNPELWLAPLSGEDGNAMGALAGRILDEQGNILAVPNIVVEHLPAPDQPSDFRIYLETYEEKKLLGLPPWEESFAAGDLPAGLYRISFVQYGMQEELVEVLPGQLTLVTFHPANSNAGRSP